MKNVWINAIRSLILIVYVVHRHSLRLVTELRNKVKVFKPTVPVHYYSPASLADLVFYVIRKII